MSQGGSGLTYSQIKKSFEVPSLTVFRFYSVIVYQIFAAANVNQR